MPSLVDKLFKSKSLLKGGGHSDLADLVRKIEDRCAEAQLRLVRYVNNSYPYGFYNPLVHWAILPAGMERPPQTRLLPSSAFIVEFRGIEGTTKRCRAYRALEALQEDLSRLMP
jgi:hypothetical protein